MVIALVGAPLAASADDAVPAPDPAPRIISGAPPSGVVGVAYAFQLASDTAGVTFSASGLPDGLSVDIQAGLVFGTPVAAGDYLVSFEAHGTSQSHFVDVEDLVISAPPAARVVSGTPPAGVVGSPYGFQLLADQDDVVFSASGLPSGLGFDPVSGLISGVPTVPGDYTVTFEAHAPNATDHFVEVEDLVIADIPAADIISGALPDGTVSAPYSFTLASDTVGVTFSAIGLPEGLELDPATGVISGIPTTAGDFSVTLEALDGSSEHLVYRQRLVIHMAGDGSGPIDPTDPAAPPVFTSPAPPAATVGTFFAFTPSATSSAPVIFALTSPPPPGLSFDPATGAVSGTPTAEGQYTLVFTADNGSGTIATVSYPLVVNAAPAGGGGNDGCLDVSNQGLPAPGADPVDCDPNVAGPTGSGGAGTGGAGTGGAGTGGAGFGNSNAGGTDPGGTGGSSLIASGGAGSTDADASGVSTTSATDDQAAGGSLAGPAARGASGALASTGRDPGLFVLSLSLSVGALVLGAGSLAFTRTRRRQA